MSFNLVGRCLLHYQTYDIYITLIHVNHSVQDKCFITARINNNNIEHNILTSSLAT